MINGRKRNHDYVIKWKHFPRYCAGNSPVPGEFPAQRPVTRSFDVFFDLRPNKRLSKKWWGWWFETSSCPLWRHSNDRGSNTNFNSIALNSSPPDKMSAISQTTFSYAFILMIFCNVILFRISPKFVPVGPIDNKTALVQVMAWCRI